VNGDPTAIRLIDVRDAAELGDPAVCDVLKGVGRYLGIGLASLINAFNPRRLVLGRELSILGAQLLPTASQEVRFRSGHYHPSRTK
jgi:predicted NBD/HSP70 family sugar kinase